MEISRWIATVASIWIQCSCGASYAFAIYSSVLKSSQGYDQSTLDKVSVFKDIGANFGVLSGLLFSAVASNPNQTLFKGGPWVVHLAGAVQCFAGYFPMWLAVTGVIHRPPVPLMCLLMFLAAHAQTFFNTANVVVAVGNFPDYGGTIVGIMKGFLGLSGAILIQIYQTLFNGKPSRFLLMLSVFPTFVSLMLMPLVKPNPARTTTEKKHLNSFSLIALFIATYLMVLIIIKNLVPLPLWARSVTCLILLLLLSTPLKVAFNARNEDSIGQVIANNNGSVLEPETPPDASQEKDMNILQAARTINFWLLFICMICGMGSGLATINNISQIGESMSYKRVEINTLVSLWSIWNFLGRFGAGYVSDLCLHKYGWGRPLFIAITQATMTLGHLIIASGFSKNLYIGSVLVGICYGSQWSLMPTITSEIFGLKHMGTIFNAIAGANPVGSYIFSVQVIGHIYDKKSSGKSHSCHGIHCFRLSFLIFSGVTLFGFLVSLVLFLRTRRFYMLILLKRQKNSAG